MAIAEREPITGTRAEPPAGVLGLAEPSVEPQKLKAFCPFRTKDGGQKLGFLN